MHWTFGLARAKKPADWYFPSIDGVVNFCISLASNLPPVAAKNAVSITRHASASLWFMVLYGNAAAFRRVRVRLWRLSRSRAPRVDGCRQGSSVSRSSDRYRSQLDLHEVHPARQARPDRPVSPSGARPVDGCWSVYWPPHALQLTSISCIFNPLPSALP